MGILKTRHTSASHSLRFEQLEDRRLLANVPTGFTESVVATDLTSPITFDIEESGRIWLAFQDGRIGVIEEDQLLPSPAITLEADGSGERGLQGLELDPDFENNGFLYVYYTAATPESHNRVSRLTVDQLTGNTIVSGSEQVLLDLPGFSTLPSNQSPIWHMGGAVHFLADGTLAVQVGDHLNNELVQNNHAPLGKVLRLNKDGSPVVDNPYYDPADNNPPGGNDWNGNAPGDVDWIDYVWASGLRNPYSGDVDPDTGRYFINDVGGGSWEEIDDATSGGENFGWPTTEGHFDAASFPEFTNPFHSYSHGEDCAITGGAFNSTTFAQFPAEYQGMYFFSQFCAGKIRVINPNDSNDVEDFITGAVFPMNVEFAPDGSMYYIERGAGAGGAPGIGTGQVLKVEFSAAVAPQFVQQPEDQLISVGYDATLSVSATGSAPLAYQWQRNDGEGFVNISGAISPELVLSSVTLAEDNVTFRALVSNPHGTIISDPAMLDVTTDTPPIANITLPLDGATYRAGDIVSFSGGATDSEDGPLSAAAMTWQIDFHHDSHLHPFFPPTSGIDAGQFVIPVNSETSPNVWFRIRLIAEDSAGLKTEVIRDVHPVTSIFTPATNVNGSSILVDGQPKETPLPITGVVNVNRSLEAPTTVIADGATATFVQWLDGHASPQRTIATPNADTAYVALYQAPTTEPLVKINFQLATAPTPDGYFPDSGQLFASRGNGWTYGWSFDHTDGSRDRDTNLDQRLDTLVHFHNGGEWEIAIPNGTYWVTASTGDAGFASNHTLNVEGVNYWTNETLAGNEFAVSTQQVTINDGLLTLNQGLADDKATRINYLEISSEEPTQALLPFTTSDVDLNGKLDLDDALAFAAGWGQDGTSLDLEARVRQGDLDFDGDTDSEDWALFNARWLSENNAPISLDALLNPLPGDYNRDGRVSRSDYLLWRSSYGSMTSLAADGNGDNIVDSIDYAIWRKNLGTSSGNQIFLDNLVLYIDPLTGEGHLKNDTNTNLELFGYTIASSGGALLPADGAWNSLSDQGLVGWDEASPSSSALTELSASEILSFSPGETIHLGKVFDATSPLTGLSMEFVEFSSATTLNGTVVFSEFFGHLDPPALHDLALYIDPGTGETMMRNDSQHSVDLVGYSILAHSPSLAPGEGDWNSLADQRFAGWEESAPTPTALTELNPQESLLLSPGQSVNLGALFLPAAVKSGVTFEYAVANSQEPIRGIATFADLPVTVPAAPAGTAPPVSPSALLPATDKTGEEQAPPAPSAVKSAYIPASASRSPLPLPASQSPPSHRSTHADSGPATRQPDPAQRLLLYYRRARPTPQTDNEAREDLEAAVDQAFEHFHPHERPLLGNAWLDELRKATRVLSHAGA